MHTAHIRRCERVTGRKARGLQTEERGCKCQTFFISPLSGGRKQTTSVQFFSFSIQNWKAISPWECFSQARLMKLCIRFAICLSSKWFHLRLTFFLFSNLGLIISSTDQYSYQLFYGWGMTHLVPSYLKNAYCGRGAWWISISLEVSLLSD